MTQRTSSLILLGSLLPAALALAAAPDRVEITFGTPSIWSLEQAHYLLARIHDLNGSLETRKPTDEDLDPNAFHSSRFNMLKSLISAQAAFDEGAGLSNRLAAEEFRGQIDRRDQLRARRTRIADEHLEAVRRVAVLKTERAAMADDDPRVAAQAAAIQAGEAEVAVLAAEVGTIDSELASLTVAKPTFSSPSGLGTGEINASQTPPEGLIDEAAKEAAKLNDKPKLHASMVLENFIQMQYEVLAKQLTLLRDEAGPCKRVLFFELPQSFYPVPKRADNYLTQTRWRISEILRGKSDCRDLGGKKRANARATRGPGDRVDESTLQQRPMTDKKKLLTVLAKESRTSRGAEKDRQRELQQELQEWHTVDVIPRRSAFNVTATHGKVKGFALAARLQWLGGFGGGMGLRRQRESLERLAEQDLFISGFGKGEETFGWTFAPLPRQKRVVPGVSTTYAVLVVPEETEFVRLEAEGCYYPRKQAPPPQFSKFESAKASCPAGRDFLLRVPDQDSGFFVDAIRYTPVPQGQTQTLVLLGNFSPQTGILIDGVPLRRRISIGGIVRASSQGSQLGPELASNGSGTIVGEYEMVNRRTLIATFSMGRDFVGTPIVSLVTPAKTSQINYFDVKVNGRSGRRSLKQLAAEEPMFTRELTLERVVPLAASGGGRPPGLLIGTGFKGLGDEADVFVNGQAAAATVKSQTEIHLAALPADASETWDVRVEVESAQGLHEEALTILNPLVPRVTGYEILKLTHDSSGQPASLDVKLVGSGLSQTSFPVKVHTPGVTVQTTSPLSDSALYLQLEKPANPTVLQLDSRSIAGRASVASVALPLPPKILSITPAKGVVKKEHNVIIKGEHLLNVRSVKFGSSAARIASQTATALEVIAPAIAQAVPAKVHLATDVVFHGRRLTNVADFNTAGAAQFTYEPEKKKK